MLRIRKEQMEAFSDYMRGRFEDRMAAYLRKGFPEDCETMGDDAARESIRDGSAIEGTLGRNGRARHEGIARGNCQITFPDMDAEAWEARA